MKIKFIEGTILSKSGKSAIWSEINHCYVKGYFKVTRTSGYNYSRTQRLNEKIKKKIVIVKQKSKWWTFKTLIHELFHWFIFTFVTREDNKYDKWLDRK